MLVLNDISVHYGRTPAVKNLSLKVDEGQIVGLIGPNGAGKSTTLLAICGALTPASGEIIFEGASLVGEAPEDVLRRGISLVPEGRQIFADLTVEENLIIGATVQTERKEVQKDIDRMVNRFPVFKTYFRSSAGKLSGGEQQQLAIARALLSRPRLVLLDEPSLGLAPFLVDQVFEIIEGLREEGVTILLVEQNAARAVDLADYTYVLRSGAPEMQGTRAELLNSADFVTAYFGER